MAAIINGDVFLNGQETADFLGVSREWITKSTKNGTIPKEAVSKKAERVVYHREKIRKWGVSSGEQILWDEYERASRFGQGQKE